MAAGEPVHSEPGDNTAMGTKDDGSIQVERRDPLARARAVGYTEDDVASVLVRAMR